MAFSTLASVKGGKRHNCMTEVRVRIAPSPTGSPHVGTAYIALFNYAFARVNKGKFILRIEDTDKKRSHIKHEEAILDAFRWIGLKWDEGPDIGGEYAPYRQSERTEIYRQHAEQLVIKGVAYRCFCEPERLQKMREEQQKRQQTVRYDGKCRSLSENAVAKKLREKVPYVVRLKTPQRGQCVIDDRLRGQVVYDYKQIDDQILLKSDGFPTYHLANVVDDHLMKISHVIRGEEWLTSTPKHVLIYECMGWDKPEFIHMPLLLNPDGSKLSKRKNPTSIFYYRDAGYLPEALLNYLGLMGYSRPNGEEKFTLEEMIQDFDINRVKLGGAVFDLKKLAWLCGKYIRENFTPETLQQRLVEWRFNPQFLTKILPHMHQRMDTLGDFMPLCSFLWARENDYFVPDFIPPGANLEETVKNLQKFIGNAVPNMLPKNRTAEETIKVLQCFLFNIETEPYWNAEWIEKKIHEVAETWEWKIRELTGTLFLAISGKKVAPPLYNSMELLGKDLTRVRIVNAIQKLGGISQEALKELEQEWWRKYRDKTKADGEGASQEEEKLI